MELERNFKERFKLLKVHFCLLYYFDATNY